MEEITPKNDMEKIQKNHIKFKPYTLLVRKFNSQIFPRNAIKSEISDFFNSPDKFFDINSRVCLNKKINLNKITPIEKVAQKDKAIKESIRSTKNNSKYSSSIRERHIPQNFLNNKERQSIKRNFELIDNEKLKNIFNSFKRNIKPTKRQNEIYKSSINNNSSQIIIPKQISLNLSIQSRRLQNQKHIDRQSRNISKYLSKKLHKNESDLLINGVHLYRYKKEILDEDEDKDNPKKITDQSCLFKWISSLRRPKNFFGKRESYINVSSENNPLWSIVVEKYPITKEMSVKSGYNLNNRDYKDFKRKRNLSTLNSAKLRTVENLDNLSVKGKKLFNIEYNRELSNNNCKILHKVFVDNGKVILYKDVNDIFGNETLYKNYNYRSNETSLGNRSLDNMMVRSLSTNSMFS